MSTMERAVWSITKLYLSLWSSHWSFSSHFPSIIVADVCEHSEAVVQGYPQRPGHNVESRSSTGFYFVFSWFMLS